jgi:DeoR/GlpR family transcriptional regulator of sugar metabolism
MAQDPASRRRDEIAEYVTTAGTARTDDMAERFGVSAMTITRDLDALASEGWLERTRGGARVGGQRLQERNVSWRSRQQVAQKMALARQAVTHLGPGMTIALEDSTTIAAMIPLLPELRPLTVITNFLPTIVSITAEPDIDLVALGGQFDRNLSSFDGPAVIDQLRLLNADAVVMSSAAVHDGQLLHPSADIARRKRAFLEVGELKILLLDATKFDLRSAYRVAPVDEFDIVIVDSAISDEQRASLERHDVQVEVVDVLPADIQGSARIDLPELLLG